MPLSKEDLVALLKREVIEVIFEREDPRDSYTQKEITEKEIKTPSLIAGQQYIVNKVELDIKGMISNITYKETIESLMGREFNTAQHSTNEAQHFTISTETSKVYIEGYKIGYSPFCFRLKKSALPENS